MINDKYLGNRNLIIIATCRSGHNFIMNQIRNWDKKKEINICNAECLRPELYQKEKNGFVANKKLIDFSLPTYNIVIVRDLLDWWASYLTWKVRANKIHFYRMFNIWKAHVKEAYGVTNYISNFRLNYEKFNKEKKERENLATNILNLSFDDSKVDKVAIQGHGSSFDKNIKGSSMKTDERFLKLLDNNNPNKEIYLRYLKDNFNREALELYNYFFNKSEKKEEVVRNILA